MAAPVPGTSATGATPDGGATSLTFSLTCSGSNRYLLVGVTIDWEGGNEPTVSTITFNGDSLTVVESITHDGSVGRSELWELVNPDSATGNVVITLSGGLSQEIAAVATPFTGAHQTTPRGTAAEAQGTGTGPTLNLTSATDELAFGMLGVHGASTITSGGGQTRQGTASANNATPAVIAQTAHDTEAGATSVTLSWTLGTSQEWGIIAASIKSTTTTHAGAASLTLTVTRTTAGAVDEGEDYDFKATLTLPTAIDLTERVRTFNVRRGRSGSLDRIQAGTASVTYKNGDGAPLDPGNVDSPYYPDVRVLAEQTLSRRINGVTYYRFKGRVERFVPDWIPPSYQEQQVEAADAFEALASLKLVSDHATLTTALAGANNDLVFTARQAGDRGDEITVEYVVAGNNTALDGDVNEPLQAAAWLRFLAPSHDIASVILGRQDILSPVTSSAVGFELNGSEISIQVSTDGAGAATSTASQIKSLIEATPSLDELVSVALAPGNSGAGIVTALAPTALNGGKWPQEFTGARINRVLDTVGWPAVQRRIDPGLFEVVAQGFAEEDNASALSHCQDCADSDLGYFFAAADGYAVFHDGGHRGRETRSVVSQAIFSDANTGAGYVYHRIEPEYSHDHVFNRVSVTAGYEGAKPQVVEDAASQLLYSPVPGTPVPRDFAKQTLLADDAGALAVAEAILAARKDAKVRFPRIALFDRDDPPGWPSAVYAREIGDLVTLATQPPGHTSTGSYDCFIEEIVDEGQPGSPSEITFGLSLVSEGLDPEPGAGGALKDSTGDDFILDSATLGVLG